MSLDRLPQPTTTRNRVVIGDVTFELDDRLLHGLAADRPTAAAAHAVVPFAYYNAVDTQAVTQTDGTNWVPVV